MMAKKNTVGKLTVLQICNELKINGYFRKFVEKKYKGEKFYSKEWKSKLSNDGLEVK